MAVSAFRSSSRRSDPSPSSSTASSSSKRNGDIDSSSKTNPPPMRRSRSVSAFSRDTTTLDVVVNKRDNPLFRYSNDSTTPSSETNRRGRSVSRVDSGRSNRSLSRGPRSVISKSENEHERTTSKAARSFDELKGLKTWSSQHRPPSHADDLSVQAMHFEDDTATSTSIYETVRSEVRRVISEIQNDLQTAMQRGSIPTLATSDISDIPPDQVNPSAVELVLDIRREYAKKLEQSKERARKLQSDLAVEENRGQELSRILKEVLPDPKISNASKSRPGRKTSIERRKMSKKLTDEALVYFDECVSLSTFDSSDFSSPEDPPFNLVGITTPADRSLSLLQESSSTSVMKSSNCSLNEKQALGIQNQFGNVHNPSELITNSGLGEPTLNLISPNSGNRAKEWKFSFAQKPTETLELQPDIKKYIRHYEKDTMELPSVRSISFDLGEYSLQAPAESYMFDRVLFGNRIRLRSVLLCGGGISSSFSPFSSFF